MCFINSLSISWFSHIWRKALFLICSDLKQKLEFITHKTIVYP
jgi:hypothetical protein